MMNLPKGSISKVIDSISINNKNMKKTRIEDLKWTVLEWVIGFAVYELFDYILWEIILK